MDLADPMESAGTHILLSTAVFSSRLPRISLPDQVAAAIMSDSRFLLACISCCRHFLSSTWPPY